VRKTLFAALSAASLLAVGCTDLEPLAVPAPQAEASACGSGEPQSFVISTLGFTRVDMKTGTVPGFDVDGVVSDGTDEGSCFKKDYRSPGGQVGIDNQLAGLIPDIEKVLGNAVDGLIQGAINNGDLLILLQVDAAKNLENDPCVNLTVQIGKGKPTLGTDGVIEGYQTYDIDPAGEVSHATKGKIENGELTIGPFELAIPIAIFDVAFTVHVHDALFRFTTSAEDGVIKGGVLGGGIVPQEILDGVAPGAGVDKYIPVLTVVLKGATDLKPDDTGTCQQLSAALQITAVNAFIRQ